MSMMTPIVAAPGQAWDDACLRFNAFRGEAIHHFAAAELAVSETLLVLHSAGYPVLLQLLVGQRFEALRLALAPDREIAGSAAALRALTEFTPFECWRPILCHAVAKVMLDQEGRWCTHLRSLSFRHGCSRRDDRMLEEREGATLRASLVPAAGRLISVLSTLRTTIASAT